MLLRNILLAVLVLINGLNLAISQYRELFGARLPLWLQHHDFMAYYSAGVLAATHRINQIYQSAPLIEIQRHIIANPVGAAGYMPFLNPPPVAYFMGLFAGLNEPTARIIWWSINLLIMAVCAWFLTKNIPPLSRIIAIAAIILSLPVFQALIEGQVSIIILAGILLAIELGRRRHPLAAGVALSVLWIKPQFAVIALILLALTRAWRALAAYTAAPALVFLILLPFTGGAIYATYLGFLFGVLGAHFTGAGAITPSVWSGALDTAEGLNGFFVSIFGQTNLHAVNVFTAITSVTLLIPTIWLFIGGTRPGLNSYQRAIMLAAIGSTVMLIDPHLYLQDVVFIFAALPLIRTKHTFTLAIATVILVTTPIFDSYIHFHIFTLLLFVVTMSTFTYLIVTLPPKNKQTQ